jgi:hypothetical protein
MLALLPFLLAAASHPHRNPNVPREFQRLHPCPFFAAIGLLVIALVFLLPLGMLIDSAWRAIRKR